MVKIKASFRLPREPEQRAGAAYSQPLLRELIGNPDAAVLTVKEQGKPAVSQDCHASLQ
jgi:hypothetical protein